MNVRSPTMGCTMYLAMVRARCMAATHGKVTCVDYQRQWTSPWHGRWSLVRGDNVPPRTQRGINTRVKLLGLTTTTTDKVTRVQHWMQWSHPMRNRHVNKIALPEHYRSKLNMVDDFPRTWNHKNKLVTMCWPCVSRYQSNSAYGQSKLANILHVKELAKRLKVI